MKVFFQLCETPEEYKKLAESLEDVFSVFTECECSECGHQYEIDDCIYAEEIVSELWSGAPDLNLVKELYYKSDMYFSIENSEYRSMRKQLYDIDMNYAVFIDWLKKEKDAKAALDAQPKLFTLTMDTDDD